MHDVDAWDWVWMIPMMFVMMSAWIAPIVLAVYFVARLSDRRPEHRSH